ncbi:MAG: G5 domain-containing protein [Anaerolineales bacterium]|nr:G5 domain-containing protein [Anaerolineales bacterium]
MKPNRTVYLILHLLLITGLLAACGRPQATARSIEIQIEIDDQTQAVAVPAGSTVQQSLDSAGIALAALDRVDPPAYTTVDEGTLIRVTRVSERFEIEEIVIPYERQTIRNESLPEGETRLLQPGQNGRQEITYRVIEEGGEEISRAPVKNVILENPLPEILMVGTQSSHTPISIQGKLVYISGGNAWLISGNSGNRRPVVVYGDLDGRILQVSPDGDWLLFSRSPQEADGELINELWVVSLDDAGAEPFDLGIRNVIHFADWVPLQSSLIVAYSTVEASPSPPGWQANNDLKTIVFSEAGRVLRERTILDASAGGQYGWWGTSFAWGRDDEHLAYIRADSVGIVDFDNETFVQVHEITPFQTLEDWAWVPGIAWGQDQQSLYFVDHGEPVGIENPQSSPIFHLAVNTQRTGQHVLLSQRAGMFAYPSVSPILDVDTPEIAYKVAFFQAINPLESKNSSYRLVVIDRDGSNRRVLFPPEGEPGLDPALPGPVWSPAGDRIAVIYRNDLWVIDIQTGVGQQLTNDGQAILIDWSS